MVVGISQVIGMVREPLRSYSFEVELPYDFGNAELLRYQVRSVQFPIWFDLDTEKIRVEGVGYYFLPSDFRTEGMVRLEFWENSELSVQSYFLRWRELFVGESVVGTPYRELKALPSQWMRDISIYLLDGKGNRVGGYLFRKSYPIAVDAMSLDYTRNDLVIVNVTLAVHGVEVK